MKKSRFREEQMVTILREANRRPVPEVAKQHRVLSKNPIDAVRRADSTLDARRVVTFVTAESLCSARPVCRLFPKCCSSSSWPSPTCIECEGRRRALDGRPHRRV